MVIQVLARKCIESHGESTLEEGRGKSDLRDTTLVCKIACGNWCRLTFMGRSSPEDDLWRHTPRSAEPESNVRQDCRNWHTPTLNDQIFPLKMCYERSWSTWSKWKPGKANKAETVLPHYLKPEFRVKSSDIDAPIMSFRLCRRKMFRISKEGLLALYHLN